MPIVSSEIVEDRAQRDGRRAVRVRHTDHAGGVHEETYLAEADQDVTGGLTDAAARVLSGLELAEHARNLMRAYEQQAPQFTHTTAAQFRLVLRAAYKDARDWEAARMGAFVQSLGLSDAQLTNLFGVSGAQLTALKSRLAAQAQHYADVAADQGE